MADDTSKRGAQDRSRINLSEGYEVQYWTKELGVSRERLDQLVREHGNAPEKVREALRKSA